MQCIGEYHSALGLFSALGGGGGIIIGTVAGYQDLCGGHHERIRGCPVHLGEEGCEYCCGTLSMHL